jgi:4,5-dihydroxyphthalate decarboxylase
VLESGAAVAMASSSVACLKTNLADYPVTLAMKDGRVTSDLVKLDYCGPKVANKGFKAMVRENAYDAGELAIITYLQARAWGKPFVLLPSPISGRFQHHCIGFNQELGLLKPKDIEGSKVGVRTYSQTTGLWVRGILQHEYGVDLDKVTWLTLEDAHVTEFRDPSNCRRLAAGCRLAEMMLSGELAAAILGGDMPKDPRVQTLIPNAAAAAQEWYRREGVIPINHMFVVRAELSKERPEVVRDIYRMIVESRQFAPESATRPPLGLEANRKALELAIQWSYEQKIIPRRLSVDELFDDTTAALGT